MTRLRRLAPVLIAIALISGCDRGGSETAVSSETFANAPVIVISIDTLRADRLPAWGYEGVKTPNIDRLRSDGILYRNAYSQVPLTLPSHVSMLTGLLPAEHGVRDNLGYRFAPRETGSLPQSLKQRGYATGAAVSSYVLRGTTGLRELFDWYDDPIAFTPGSDLGSIQRAGAETIASAQQWISQRGAAPFFLFLHLFEPHTPYSPPEPFRSATSNPYDGEIAYADSLIGKFLDELRSSGVYDRAIVILMSDHGEGLGDHGEREHGIFVYREAIHVPLLVKLPKNSSAGATVENPVGLVDLFPTVLSLLGEQPSAKLAGVALLGSAAKPVVPRRIFSESIYPRLHLGWSDTRSLIDGGQHYIDAPRSELYDLAADPSEQNNIAAEERRAAASFRDEIARFEKKLTAPGAASAEEVAKLAALGYISAPASSLTGELPDAKDRIAQYEQFRAAKDAIALGNAQNAIQTLRDVLAGNPKFTDAQLELARAYEATRQDREAAEVWRNLLASNPALTEQAAIGVATALLNLGQLNDARKHAELALTANPGAAHLLLGRIALAAKTPVIAQKHARDAARDTHYAPQAALLLSESLLAAGPRNAAEALRVLDELKAKGGAPVRGLETARASALMRMSRTAEAIDALRAEIRLQPQNPDPYRRLAAIHLLQKDVPAAETVFGELVSANPSPGNYRAAAETLAHFGYRDAAASWARRGAARATGLR